MMKEVKIFILQELKETLNIFQVTKYHKYLHKLPQIIVLIFTIILSIPPAIGVINIEKLESQGGYQILKQSEVYLIQNFSKILHIINVNELEVTLNKIEDDIDEVFPLVEDEIFAKQLKIQIIKTRHNIKTITFHRHKRGLINLGGKIGNWLFGIMDSDDKADIEEHLNTIDLNNRQTFMTLNKQIKINDNLQKNIEILQQHIEENQILTLKTLNYTTDITRKSIKNIHFLSILANINLLNIEVDKIQQNIAFAKYGVMSHSILTDEEIDEYDINIYKYKNIQSSLLRFDEKLIFIILIPNFSKDLAVKYKVIPVTNNDFEEIFIENNNNIILFKNQIFLDNDDLYIKNLKLTKGCINSLMNEKYDYCRKIINKNFELIEILPNLILVKNAKNVTLFNDCNHVKYKLFQNYLVTFNNCTIRINDVVFSNKEKLVENHLTIPNFVKINNVEFETNIEKINLKQIENIKEIEEIKYKNNNHNIVIYIISSLIILIFFIVISYIVKIKFCANYILENKNDNIKNIKDDVQLNDGGVIYSDISIKN